MDSKSAHVTALRVRYFDTVPPAADMCIMRNGMIFCGSEFGDHSLYRFISLGDDGDGASPSDGSGGFFEPDPQRNLELVERVASLSPPTAACVDDLCGEGMPQMFAACGRAGRSSLRVLRRGVVAGA